MIFQLMSIPISSSTQILCNHSRCILMWWGNFNYSMKPIKYSNYSKLYSFVATICGLLCGRKTFHICYQYLHLQITLFQVELIEDRMSEIINPKRNTQNIAVKFDSWINITGSNPRAGRFVQRTTGYLWKSQQIRIPQTFTENRWTIWDWPVSQWVESGLRRSCDNVNFCGQF